MSSINEAIRLLDECCNAAVDTHPYWAGERRLRESWGGAVAELRGATLPVGYTYALRSASSGLIKVGRARDPVSRIAQLQCGSAEALELVGLCHGFSVERSMHRMLTVHRRHGEWFQLAASPIPPIEDEGCLGCVGATSSSRGADSATALLDGLRQAHARMVGR